MGHLATMETGEKEEKWEKKGVPPPLAPLSFSPLYKTMLPLATNGDSSIHGSTGATEQKRRRRKANSAKSFCVLDVAALSWVVGRRRKQQQQQQPNAIM
jgi:hypothetical protein